jgi:hypothetical protein
MKANHTTPALTAEQLEAKIALKLLNSIDAADAKGLADALGNYGMFTAAQYRRACTLQAHTLTKAPTLAP